MNATSQPLRHAPVIRALLAGFIWRHWLLQTKRCFLLLLLLAVGVASFFAIRLANRAAVSSFSSFTEAVTRQTDATLQAPAGFLPESILPNLRRSLKGTAVEIIPILELVAAPPRSSEDIEIGNRRSLSIVGLDLVALQNLQDREPKNHRWFDQNPANHTQPKTEQNGLWEILNQPNAVFCSHTLASKLGLKIGDKIPVVLNDRLLELHIRGFIPQREDQPAPPDNLLVMDLPALQKLANKTGLLERIEFLFPKDKPLPEHELLARIQTAAADSARLKTRESRKTAAEVMTQGFRLNLTILSLLALLVGVYLIFQTLDAAVVRRRSEIGTLRALGVTPWEIRATWLLEACGLGIVGGMAGIAGGWLLAQGAVRVVSKTVNALYYANNVNAAKLHWDEAALALILAAFASVFAGWIPAKKASVIPPAQLLAKGGAQPETAPASLWKGGLPLLLAALGLYQLPPLPLEGGGRFPLAGYLAALAAIVGGSIIAGELLRLVALLLRPAARHNPSLQLASSHLRRPTSRHRWAVAGLLCAVAMTGGMTILVSSFEKSVSRWIQQTLQADLYLTSDANQTATSYNRIPEVTWRAILQNSDVVEADVALILPLELAKGPVRLVGSDLAFSQRRNQFTWLVPPKNDALFRPSENATLCIVSEAFTERFGVKPGDLISVPSPSGVHQMEIAGVYSDYGDEKGVIMMQREHLAAWHGTQEASTLSVVVREGVNPLQLQAQLRTDFPGLAILTNSHLRNEVMRIFRQTFAITYALEAIGVIVAVAGLGITLASILLERKAELSILRSLGMTPRSVAHATAMEGCGIALCASLGGVAASLGLGAILIFVVNKQTFGWTLQPQIPSDTLAALCALVVASGTLTAWCVGRWGSSLPSDRVA